MTPKLLAVAVLSAWADAAAAREARAATSWWKGRRFAFVKSSAYRDLYDDASSSAPLDLLRASTQRTGPLGLFTHLGADFHLVREEPDPECRVHEERAAREAGHPETVRIRGEIQERQRARAVPADAVDWGRYDVVVCAECAVPARIARRFPRTLWCTWAEDHRMPAYAAWRRRLPEGYHRFLNLRSGPTPWARRRPHEVDFSYGFKPARSLSALYPETKDNALVHVEDHQPAAACGALLPGVTFAKAGQGRPLVEFLRTLVRAVACFAPEPARPLGGLLAIDAAASDTLYVGNRRALWNPFCTVPALHCTSIRAGLRLVERLLGDAPFRARCLDEQRSRCDWFCFHRALAQMQP